MTFAIYFDGTLCEDKFPLIGEPKIEIIDYIKDLQIDGNQVVMFTHRTGEQLKEAVKWCKKFGIYFTEIKSGEVDTDCYTDNKNIPLLVIR